MNMPLNELQRPSGASVFYSDAFRQMIEDHLEYLRTHPTTIVMDVDPQVAHKGDGNLISVLQDYDIPAEHHWIFMRLNRYTSPMQYRADHLTLLAPAAETVGKLLAVHRVTAARPTTAT
jgi:hypothetical protein